MVQDVELALVALLIISFKSSDIILHNLYKLVGDWFVKVEEKSHY